MSHLGQDIAPDRNVVPPVIGEDDHLAGFDIVDVVADSPRR
jgi:hypothetical protein